MLTKVALIRNSCVTVVVIASKTGCNKKVILPERRGECQLLKFTLAKSGRCKGRRAPFVPWLLGVLSWVTKPQGGCRIMAKIEQWLTRSRADLRTMGAYRSSWIGAIAIPTDSKMEASPHGKSVVPDRLFIW